MREYMVLILLILVLRSTNSLPQAEIDACNSLKASLSPDPGWVGVNPCTWGSAMGSLQCSILDSAEHVDTLSIIGPFTTIEIGSWIAGLPYLKTISVSNSTFSAPISDQIAAIRKLNRFDLWSCFNVQFPVFANGVTSPLRELHIIDTDMGGEFPDLRPFQNLSSLSFVNNQIDGALPSYLGRNYNLLRGIILRNNRLTGSIPIEITQIPLLQSFYVTGNRLTGTIPPEFGAIVGLRQLHFSNNQLNGTIPRQLASGSVLYQSYNGNKLTGTIPAEFGTMTYLLSFDVSDNQLTGTVPAGLKDLPNLAYFNVSKNPLSGCLNGTFSQANLRCDVSATNLCCVPTNVQCITSNVNCVPCPQPPPQLGAKCQVNEDNEPVWVIDGDLVLTSGVEVDNIIVNGNLTITGDLSVTDGVIIVKGCPTINGTSSLFLTLTQEEIAALVQSGEVERALLEFDSACDISTLDFDEINVDGDVSDCETLKARQSTKPGLVTIIVVKDDSACTPPGVNVLSALPDWAIAVIVVGGVVVAGGVILTAILVSKKQKKTESRKMSHKLSTGTKPNYP